MIKTEQNIAHYRIIEKLGQGGMGVVYKATDTRLNRHVALKFLPPVFERDADLKDRMTNEARAIAALNHPNITSIYSIEDHDDESFIVMEYIDGRELKTVIREESLAPDLIDNIAVQLAQGLAAAHAQGIIHRDIKSQNIMLTHDNRVKIMDFGLAKSDAFTELTTAGTTLGTAAYMSPEQALGNEVNEQTDIWSLGIVLYELATGELPFSGPYEQAVIYALLNDDPPPVSTYREDLSPNLVYVIEKCLQKDQAQRYHSVTEILHDLEHGPQALPRVSGEKTLSRFNPAQIIPPKNRRMLYLSTPVILVMLTLVWGALHLWENISGNSSNGAQHVLVMPFNHIGGDEHLAALCDGLVETLTSKLTQMEKYHNTLWVVPSGEVRQNEITSAGQAYKTFGANLAVTGSLQIIDNMIRLTLNLVNTRQLRQISSEVIDVQRNQLLELQDISVNKLMAMLNLENTPRSQTDLHSGMTSNAGAYEYYLQGRGHLQHYEDTEQIDSAIDLFKRAVKLDSGYALAIAGLGEAWWRKYNATKDIQWMKLARQECEIAYQLEPDLAPVCITFGLVQVGSGEYQQALDTFNRAVKLEPENAEAYRGLANAYEALNMLPEAENTYLKSIQLKPSYWGGYNDLGVFYFRHGQYNKAADRFKQMIELIPESHRGYNTLGAVYYMQKKWPEARQLFEKSIALKPTYSAATNLGTLYFIEKEYDKAVAMYQLALKLNDKDYIVWGNLASAYQWTESGQDKVKPTYQHAIEIAEKQLEVNPRDPQLLADLAGYYSTIGNEKKSKNYIERALKLAPENINVMYHAATVYEKSGNREVALYWIEKALKAGYPLSEIEYQPELQAMYKDKRFKNLIENM